MAGPQDPIIDVLPNIDCPVCNGEGEDADPFGMFDFAMRRACPHCWEPEEKDEPTTP